MQILLLSDIHANFPALEAVDRHFRSWNFDLIVNCGDSVVYAPFPNETLSWLASKSALSILGNTDKKVIKLLQGKSLNKPSNPEKKIMYTWTAEHLGNIWGTYLQSFKKRAIADLATPPCRLGIFHGSPANDYEFLFNSTPDGRFLELALSAQVDIVFCGHSHDPFHKFLGGTHFVNPGSTGRMFDGSPTASCATLQLRSGGVNVRHHRVEYDVEKTLAAIRAAALPEIYCDMYKSARKTN
jgi:predicted phosphodiesterase